MPMSVAVEAGRGGREAPGTVLLARSAPLRVVPDGRGEGHVPAGHRRGPVDVGEWVTTAHDPNEQIRLDPRRPSRCLRHHVWMAACDECRDVRAAVVKG